MQTGWIANNGQAYYLQTNKDGREGRAYKGWHEINGLYYHFNENTCAFEEVLTFEQAWTRGVCSEEALTLAGLNNPYLGAKYVGQDGLAQLIANQYAQLLALGIDLNAAQLGQLGGLGASMDTFKAAGIVTAAPIANQPVITDGNWNYDASKDIWTYNLSGIYIAGGWARLGYERDGQQTDEMYYFREDGVMLDGLREVNGKIYYFSKDYLYRGAAQKGYVTINGIPVHFNEASYELDLVNSADVISQIGYLALTFPGLGANGTLGNDYNLNLLATDLSAADYSKLEKFAMQQNVPDISRALSQAAHTAGMWLQNEATGKWTYTLGSGVVTTGWAKILNNGHQRMYFFDNSGQMRTGWQVINGKVYYFNEANDTNMGYALKGWQNISGILCHFDENTYELSATNLPETLLAVYQLLLVVDYN